MKKYLLVLITVLGFNCIYSQVLYTENFDNHSVGNLGTDVTGKIPGQWGWYTVSNHTQSNSFFTIVNETGRGKVLEITTGLITHEFLAAIKRIPYTTIANRFSGNDVFMLEIDYYTGSKQPSEGSGFSDLHILSYLNNEYYLGYLMYELTFNKTKGTVFNNKLPFNTWLKIILYIDYPNEKIYSYIPYLNYVHSRGMYYPPGITNLIEEYPIAEINLIESYSGLGINPISSYIRTRYDNIKLTAINAVPPEIVTLSNNEQLATKFNMYPNPATNVVNITNSENMLVQQVVIYDVTGKQLSSQTFSNETQIQLNVENLASGTYMLHLQTAQGTAVKKLIKK